MKCLNRLLANAQHQPEQRCRQGELTDPLMGAEKNRIVSIFPGNPGRWMSLHYPYYFINFNCTVLFFGAILCQTLLYIDIHSNFCLTIKSVFSPFSQCQCCDWPGYWSVFFPFYMCLPSLLLPLPSLFPSHSKLLSPNPPNHPSHPLFNPVFVMLTTFFPSKSLPSLPTIPVPVSAHFSRLPSVLLSIS